MADYRSENVTVATVKGIYNFDEVVQLHIVGDFHRKSDPLDLIIPYGWNINFSVHHMNGAFIIGFSHFYLQIHDVHEDFVFNVGSVSGTNLFEGYVSINCTDVSL